MGKRTWEDEDLINAFESSQNVRQVIQKLGLAIAGGTYTSIQSHMDRLGLRFDMDWKQRRNSGLSFYTRVYEDNEVFCVGTTASPSLVRKRYENLADPICSVCGLCEWMGDPLTLDLDHINGNSKDNRLENLRWLCPNCHRQTDTWGNTGA